MKLVGLTGGIASGKSTVSHQLQEREGFPIVDCDLIAFEVVRKVSLLSPYTPYEHAVDIISQQTVNK